MSSPSHSKVQPAVPTTLTQCGITKPSFQWEFQIKMFTLGCKCIFWDCMADFRERLDYKTAIFYGFSSSFFRVKASISKGFSSLFQGYKTAFFHTMVFHCSKQAPVFSAQGMSALELLCCVYKLLPFYIIAFHT